MSIVPNNQVNSRISLYNGDITELKVDAIVNAANKILRVGSGVDCIILIFRCYSQSSRSGTFDCM